MKSQKQRRKKRLTYRRLMQMMNDLLKFMNSWLPENLQLSQVTKISDPKHMWAAIRKLQIMVSPTEIAPLPSQPDEVDRDAFVRAITIIATNAWRARNKMVDEATDEAKEEMKRVLRHIEAIEDGLHELGVEVHDFRNQVYHNGLAVKVITFESKPGLLRETIAETIRPALKWRGRYIQTGEVVVATPETR